MDMIMDLLITIADAFTFKGIIGKKHRLIDYIVFFIVMLSTMLIVIRKYDFGLIAISVLLSLLVSIVFGSITNRLFKIKKKN